MLKFFLPNFLPFGFGIDFDIVVRDQAGFYHVFSHDRLRRSIFTTHILSISNLTDCGSSRIRLLLSYNFLSDLIQSFKVYLRCDSFVVLEFEFDVVELIEGL